jgi:peptidoglycan/xylan/chitin deacetylase (PgdA/CDA1 family)
MPAAPFTGERRVAITFDDLGATPESADPELSRQILAALAREHAPVAVFANCRALTQAALSPWQAAGATLGNHTFHHLSIDAGTFAGWWSDVESCHRELTHLAGAPVGYFRFPYLRYGAERERRDAAAEHLARLGYRVAHVSAATSEWLLAGYYDTVARIGDAALARDIARAYVEHMVESLAAARSMALEKLGRDVAQITLLHVNRLAADHLPAVLAALREQGFRFVSLADALADPAYAAPDAYVGGCGCSWLARIAPPIDARALYPFGDMEEQLRARFEARVAQATARALEQD